MERRVPALKGCRILVVEDEFAVAQNLQAALEAAGAVVLGPVARVRDALDLITRENAAVDVAVLDINLHGEPSYAVADALASHGIRFVFTTGYDADAIAPPYRAYPHLEKPFDTASLLALLAPEPSGKGQKGS